MEQIIGLKDLKVGQRVKVKGKTDQNGAFTALEVKVKYPEEDSVVEGAIESLDTTSKTVRVLGQSFAVDSSALIKDMRRNGISMDSLRVGDMVKLKGTYDQAAGFQPHKIKVREPMGFQIDELQGNIDTIDTERQTLSLVGFTVVVNHKTTIEGF